MIPLIVSVLVLIKYNNAVGPPKTYLKISRIDLLTTRLAEQIDSIAIESAARQVGKLFQYRSR
jgi:hypothetical protein